MTQTTAEHRESTQLRPPCCLIDLFAVGVVAAAVCSLTGCVSPRYGLAKEGTPPAVALDASFPETPRQATLDAVITYGGPGSWKREALWDEYVVILQNHGERPLTIDSATLTDFAGTNYAAGNDPWALEKQSKIMEKQYRARGVAFMRNAAPGVLIVGAGAGAIASAGIFSAGATTAATATVVALPAYYIIVSVINHNNKKVIMAEFTRRRLALPLTLAPGETRTGSVFYPMVRDPRSLELHRSSESDSGRAALPLDFLKGLHVPAAPADTATKNASTS